MSHRKGIILAGGTGTRLHPLTIAVSKQLMPVYDKPMIYYPLSTLMLAGIKDILIITRSIDQSSFVTLLGDGSQWGLNISFATQNEPNGLPEAFVIAERWLGGSKCCLILGDNIFHGKKLSDNLAQISSSFIDNKIFIKKVSNPERYGVVELDMKNNIVSIAEKPKIPKSNLAITGLYFFDHRATQFAKTLRPSDRGETEIVDLINCYKDHGALDFERLDDDITWLDTGTPDGLLKASNYVELIEQKEKTKVSCPEETAWRLGYIDDSQLKSLAEKFRGNSYGKYLMSILESQS